jgi:hypothetical protein
MQGIGGLMVLLGAGSFVLRAGREGGRLRQRGAIHSQEPG